MTERNDNRLQPETDRIWDIIKRYSQARKSGYYLEAVCLMYSITEWQLRFLMTHTKAGKDGIPLEFEEVAKQGNLSRLIKYASTHKFIDDDLKETLNDFNKTRVDAIHYLSLGSIEYDDLKSVVETYGKKIVGPIQSNYLKFEVGEVQMNSKFNGKS
jgi:hypothetical protein